MQAYNKTDQTLHQVCQVLAKAGRSFVPKQDDDSHSNLYFDALAQRIHTHPFGDAKRTLAFNLNNSTFEWVNTRQKASPIIKLAGHTLDQLEQIIAGQLLETGLDEKAFLEPLHFEIPEYDHPKTFLPLAGEAVAEWSYYRRMANQAGNALLGFLQKEGQPRIWPHHFDTGTYCVVDNYMGFGYGLAMQDEMVGAPYFYLAGYPQKGEVNYEKKPSLTNGHWQIGEHFKGAVLPLTVLPGKGSMKMILKFVQEATEWYLR